MPLPVPSLARAAVVAGEGGAAALYPGPWDARAWAGAVLYVLLFLAALAGILSLLRDPSSPADGGTPGTPGDHR